MITENNVKEELIGIAYSDIFGSLEKQASAVKVWKKILNILNIKLAAAKLSPSGRQVRQWDRVTRVQILLVLLMIVFVWIWMTIYILV